MSTAGRIIPEQHFGLALSIARRRWRMHGILPRADYEQEAMLALVIATEQFRASRNAKFSTFAYRVILGAVINAEMAWISFNRRTRSAPILVELEDDPPAHGMTEADVAPLETMFEGEWFAVYARQYLLSGRDPIEIARSFDCRINTVHQAVSYFRRRITAELQ